MKALPFAMVSLALVVPWCAQAQTTPPLSSPELANLQREIQALRDEYEARLQALEACLKGLQVPPAGQTPTAQGSPTPTPNSAAVSAVPAAVPPAPVWPPAVSSVPAPNGFNPAISLVLSGLYTQTSRDPAKYAIAGFPLSSGASLGPGNRGLSLSESELSLAANIDPWWRGQAFISLHPDNTVSVEEAVVQSQALGEGLSLKAGRFYSSVGYLNSQHAHTWDFVDAPLAYQAMLRGQYNDDGVQVKWLAPTDQYIEMGLELTRGSGFQGNASGRNGAGAMAMSLHTGGDVGDSHTWRAGLSVLNAKSNQEGLTTLNALGVPVMNAFSGSTRVWVVDGVWKWAPEGNATRTHFKLQGEYLQTSRQGDMSYDVVGANLTDAARLNLSGWYLQSIYQFMPRWRVGWRTERLNAGTPYFGSNSLALTGQAFGPSQNAWMLDHSPSEFSRMRLQWARDRSQSGVPDHRLYLQYQMSLGAHGAHSY